MHENPQVPNFVNRDLQKHDFRLEPGLVLAVEPMVNMGKPDVRQLRDHWTVVTRDGLPSVHVEHTLAITAERRGRGHGGRGRPGGAGPNPGSRNSVIGSGSAFVGWVEALRGPPKEAWWASQSLDPPYKWPTRTPGPLWVSA